MKCRKYFFLLLLPVMAMAKENIRPFLNTGPWYPAEKEQLSQMLERFFENLSAPEKASRITGIIAPHAGFGYSGRCAARAYHCLSPRQTIRRVLLLGTSHRSGFYGACVADYTAYATPFGQVPVDTEICRVLGQTKLFKNDRDIMKFEHSLENQLPFLQKILDNGHYKIVPVIFGVLKKKDFAVMAEAIAPYFDEQTLVVASSDLTHYGENFAYTPFRSDLKKNLTNLDMGFIETIQKTDFDAYFDYQNKTGITACGFVPIGVMIRLFEKKKYRCLLADYYKSGDLTGDYSTSVSYASLVFNETDVAGNTAGELSASEQETLLKIARAALQLYLEKGTTMSTPGSECQLTEIMKKNLGVFVTLKKNKELRGCIGSIIGVDPLYRGVISNAIHAAVDDPRFPPLSKKELASVKIEISLMTPLQPLADYQSIRLGTDGVIIRDGSSQAVFLPQVATETGWSIEQFLGNLCVKAGLDYHAYKRSKSMQFYIFQAQVFAEKDMQK